MAGSLCGESRWKGADRGRAFPDDRSTGQLVDSNRFAGLVWSLVCAGIILAVCVFIPRGFCGYLCPLGTLIDVFDWIIGKRLTRFRISSDGWWVHIKYYLLLGVLVAAGFGVLLSGFVAAIPVITRGMLFIFAPIQNGAANGWHQVPPLHAGHFLSIILFVAVLSLGLLQPRFWCKYICPSGAVFSVGNLLRITERKVESSCIHCNKCVEICPFDAIKPDFTTRTTDCTFCQTCGGVCPTQAITFVGRFVELNLKPVNDPPTHETPLGRRGFLSTGIGLAASVTAGTLTALTVKAFGANPRSPDSLRLVRHREVFRSRNSSRCAFDAENVSKRARVMCCSRWDSNRGLKACGLRTSTPTGRAVPRVATAAVRFARRELSGTATGRKATRSHGTGVHQSANLPAPCRDRSLSIVRR